MSNKIAFITGASRGIGAESAAALADEPSEPAPEATDAPEAAAPSTDASAESTDD